MKQKLTKLKEEIGKFTSKVRFFNFIHSVIAREKKAKSEEGNGISKQCYQET